MTFLRWFRKEPKARSVDPDELQWRSFFVVATAPSVAAAPGDIASALKTLKGTRVDLVEGIATFRTDAGLAEIQPVLEPIRMDGIEEAIAASWAFHGSREALRAHSAHYVVRAGECDVRGAALSAARFASAIMRTGGAFAVYSRESHHFSPPALAHSVVEDPETLALLCVGVHDLTAVRGVPSFVTRGLASFGRAELVITNSKMEPSLVQQRLLELAQVSLDHGPLDDGLRVPLGPRTWTLRCATDATSQSNGTFQIEET